MTKQISAIIVTLAGRDYLERCLKTFSKQKNFSQIEIVVPCDDRIGSIDDLRQQFPDVQYIKLSGRRTYAELRSTGFQKASCPIVALTEDHCIPDPDWCANILQTHAAPHIAIGGAVDKGFESDKSSDTLLNWSVYLCDFSRYANPVPDGASDYLTDCNVSYKREGLKLVSQLWKQEFHETVVHWALKARGEVLWRSPEIIVSQQRSLQFSHALKERYAFGRLFAYTRVAQAPVQKRAFYAVVSFLLPLVLTGRIAKNVFEKKRYRIQFIRCLPLIIILNLFWSFGEFLGYLTANADSSLSPRQVTS